MPIYPQKRSSLQPVQQFSAILSFSEGAIIKALVDVRPGAERDTTHMEDQEIVRHITSLQARMNRMEMLMQQLLTIQTTSRADGERTMQMQTMLQELRLSPGMNPAGMNQPTATQQERPEIRAIREALLSGDKMKAIKLYRSVYGVGLKEAQDALNAM